jgi:hypothetical protein
MSMTDVYGPSDNFLLGEDLKIIDMSEMIAEHRLRIAEDSRVYNGKYDRTVCHCGATWKVKTGMAHALCLWMYHQRGEILKIVFGPGSISRGDGLTSRGYLDAEAIRTDKRKKI